MLVLLAMLCMHPFEWPLQGDRAFLVYMAQVVARGEPLYTVTPFGYPPLSAWLGGAWIAFCKLFSAAPGYLSLRVFAILVYALTGPVIFDLCQLLFNDRRVAFAGVLLYAGFATPMMIGCINAEPKTLIMLLAPLAMSQWIRQRWLTAGLCAGLCLIAWHPSGLYGLGLILATIFVHHAPVRKVGAFMAGGAIPLGCLALYLTLTKSWEPAWNQLVLKHLANEADQLGDSPLKLLSSLTPVFITELLHFCLMPAGMILVLAIRKVREYVSLGSLHMIVVLSVLWLGFSLLEFTAYVDYIPMLPLVLLWGLFPTAWLLKRKRYPAWLVLLSIGVYSLGDIAFMHPKQTLHQQEIEADKLKDLLPETTFITARSEQYYVLWEQQIPLKFIRYHQLEEAVVELEGGCGELRNALNAIEDMTLIKSKLGNRVLHQCAAGYLEERCSETPLYTWKERHIIHPIRRLNKVVQHYSVYPCDRPIVETRSN